MERIVERPVEMIEEVMIDKPVYYERTIQKDIDVVKEHEVTIENEVRVPI